MSSHISQLRLKGYRFPFCLRDVEDLLAERGIVVSYETILVWVEKFWAEITKQVKTAHQTPSYK